MGSLKLNLMLAIPLLLSKKELKKLYKAQSYSQNSHHILRLILWLYI